MRKYLCRRGCCPKEMYKKIRLQILDEAVYFIFHFALMLFRQPLE